MSNQSNLIGKKVISAQLQVNKTTPKYTFTETEGVVVSIDPRFITCKFGDREVTFNTKYGYSIIPGVDVNRNEYETIYFPTDVIETYITKFFPDSHSMSKRNSLKHVLSEYKSANRKAVKKVDSNIRYVVKVNGKLVRKYNGYADAYHGKGLYTDDAMKAKQFLSANRALSYSKMFINRQIEIVPITINVNVNV